MKKLLVVMVGLVVSLALVLPVVAQEQKPELDEVAKAYIKSLEAELGYLDALLADGRIAAKQAEYAKKSIQSQIESIESGKTTLNPWYAAGCDGVGGYSSPCGY